jgi:protein-disulfide isomerase
MTDDESGHWGGKVTVKLKGKHYRVVLVWAIIILSVGVSRRIVPAAPAPQSTQVSSAVTDKILKYIRDRFGVPDTVKLTLGPLHTSALAPGFNEGMVTADDGKTPRTQPILISKDDRYLIVVRAAVDLPQDTPAEITQRVRDIMKVPAALKLSIGAFKASPVADFKEGTLTTDDGRSKQNITVLLTRDGKHLVISELYNLTIDPRQVALHTIAIQGEPSQGPPNAPVTIVEFADLQCPTCARMHDFLETKIVPRYGNKVRIIFKEFPLVGIHDWSFTAAIADRCAYEINPAAYLPIRTAIFRNQQLINITNLRDTLLSYGEEAGVDRVKLAGCLDAKSSLPQVQRDMDEGKRINVNQTPTVFVNGRMLTGLPSEDAYYQAIDAALAGH